MKLRIYQRQTTHLVEQMKISIGFVLVLVLGSTYFMEPVYMMGDEDKIVITTSHKTTHEAIKTFNNIGRDIAFYTGLGAHYVVWNQKEGGVSAYCFKQIIKTPMPIAPKIITAGLTTLTTAAAYGTASIPYYTPRSAVCLPLFAGIPK